MEMETLACHNCGANNTLDSLYCAHCGTKLDHSDIQEQLIEKKVNNDTFQIKDRTSVERFSVERSSNQSASAFFLKGNQIMYKCVDHKTKIDIQSHDNVNIGSVIRTHGHLFPEWTFKNVKNTEIGKLNIHPFWKGELHASDEFFALNYIRDGNYWMKVEEVHAFDQKVDKMIKILCEPRIKKGLFGHAPAPNFTLEFDSSVDELFAVCFMSAIMRTFFILPQSSNVYVFTN